LIRKAVGTFFIFILGLFLFLSSLLTHHFLPAEPKNFTHSSNLCEILLDAIFSFKNRENTFLFSKYSQRCLSGELTKR
jgi:hypothetical protein